MNALKSGKFVFERYLLPYLQKQGVKKYVENRVNEAVDVEDFVSKYIFSIKSLNESEIELDRSFAQYIIKKSEEEASSILEKDITEWTEDDCHFIRGTLDFDKNLIKQRKVLDYLNYQKRTE